MSRTCCKSISTRSSLTDIHIHISGGEHPSELDQISTLSTKSVSQSDQSSDVQNVQSYNRAEL